jgi:hypothetical protein
MSSENPPNDNERELKILVVMRQVLSSIVRDTTPPPGMPHPLKNATIEDIRQCFALITAREKEIHASNGTDPGLRPRYKDQPRTSQVVPFIKPPRDDS